MDIPLLFRHTHTYFVSVDELFFPCNIPVYILLLGGLALSIKIGTSPWLLFLVLMVLEIYTYTLYIYIVYLLNYRLIYLLQNTYNISPIISPVYPNVSPHLSSYIPIHFPIKWNILMYIYIYTCMHIYMVPPLIPTSHWFKK